MIKNFRLTISHETILKYLNYFSRNIKTNLTAKSVLIMISLLLTIGIQGCAIYYRDRVSGIQHIFGFGHLSMKVTVPYEEKQAVIQRTTLNGIAAGIDNGSLGLSLGYEQREHILIYDSNTVITVQRPLSDDFFYFKIGSMPIGIDSINDIQIDGLYKTKGKK